MDTRKKFVLFFIAVSFTILAIGCNLNPLGNDSDSTSLVSSAPVPTGNANLSFNIKIPEGTFSNILRAADGANPEVTILLTILNTGTSSDANATYVVKKIVTAINGKANTSFNSLPAKPVIAELQIANGSIGNFSDLHGSTDLKTGSNTMTIVPVGAGDVYDRMAIMAKKIAGEVSLIKSAGSLSLISKIKEEVESVDFASADAIETVFNNLVTEIAPAGLFTITTNVAEKKFAGTDGTTNWSQNVADLLQEVDFNDSATLIDFVPKLVIKQGLGDYAYVYAEITGSDLAVVIKINSADGSFVSAMAIRGNMQKFLELSDGTVVMAGYATKIHGEDANCPYVLRWDPSKSGSFFGTMPEDGTFEWIKSLSSYPDNGATRAQVIQLNRLVDKIVLAIKKSDGTNVFEKFDESTGPTGTGESLSRTIFGIAVDPYIEGTKFFFDANDNKIFDSGEPVSTATDENGNFTLSGAISDAHDILTLTTDFGKHLGKDFPYQMRSKLQFQDSNGKVIVSPVTSVVAWGLELSTLLQTINTEFQNAGISETLTEADITGNPLEGLEAISVSNLTDNDLRKIRAIIAIQQYIATLKKIENNSAASFTYQITEADFTDEDNKKLLQGLAEIVKNGCNVEFIRSSNTSINSALDNVATQVENQGGSITSEQLNNLKSKLELKAIDVAKTCVSIANYCSNEIVKQAVSSGGAAGVDSEFFTNLVTKTSGTLVPQIGPRYYFQRVKSIIDARESITGTSFVDEAIWTGIQNNLSFTDPYNSSENISVDFIDSTWSGFKGIDIGEDGKTLSPLK